jgi:C4-dicarboxylate transporter, DctM subunit
MIPPSGVMVIYGLLTDQDISQLFIAGILPGILAIGLYVLTVQILAWRRADWLPRGRVHSWAERWESLRGIWATGLLFAFVIGGMYGGLFTVTEAAGMGAVGALVIGVLRGQLNGPRIMTSLIEALRITAAIFTIAVGAFLFGYFLTITQTTQNLTSLLLGLDLGRYGVLAIILFAYLILGAIMDELAMILLTVPIVFPVIIGLGFDPIWFGVIIVMVVTLGMICPPVGINCFVINSIARDLSLVSIYRGVSPFILTDIIRLAILCAVPWISLVLPNTMK